MWSIPEASAEFVACMEDVLDLYEHTCDPKRPLVCFDEWLKQLIAETRLSLPAKPDQVERYDYKYQRNGVRNLNIFFETLVGQRHVKITQRRTMQDFALCKQWLVDEIHPEAEIIQVILDNLNTHKPASLYETFPPAEAPHLHLLWINLWITCG